MRISKYFNNEDFKLCYVDGSKAYFTTKPVSEQWGDDWDDAPYEHNAGTPYNPSIFYYSDGSKEKYSRDWNADGSPRWEIIKVAFDSDLQTPDYGFNNSPYSVKDINAGMASWLCSPSYVKERAFIHAGVKLLEFIRVIKQCGGEVFVPFEWLNSNSKADNQNL